MDEDRGSDRRDGAMLGEIVDVLLGTSSPSRRDVDAALVESFDSRVATSNQKRGPALASKSSPPRGVETLTSIGCYRDPLASLVATAKYSAFQGVLHRLGRRLGVELCATAPWLETMNGRPVVIPTPMPMWRRAHRGIDHAGVMAQGVALEIGGVSKAWLSSRWRAPQVGSGCRSRRNTRHRITPSWKWFLDRGIAGRTRLDGGRSVILIDDVMTTGSTMAACARVLHEMGLERVHGGVLLRPASWDEIS